MLITGKMYLLPKDPNVEILYRTISGDHIHKTVRVRFVENAEGQSRAHTLEMPLDEARELGWSLINMAESVEKGS
jgi:hypothetical protein